ncbi:hypothetical protein GCM10028793_58540 [Nocardiopsis oceani]
MGIQPHTRTRNQPPLITPSPPLPLGLYPRMDRTRPDPDPPGPRHQPPLAGRGSPHTMTSRDTPRRQRSGAGAGIGPQADRGSPHTLTGRDTRPVALRRSGD